MTQKEFLHKFTARYRKNLFYANLLGAAGKRTPDHKWVFILGCYNSGTTLLDQILSNHPRISGLPDEGVMLTNQLVRPEDFKWRRMWWKCEEEMKDYSARRKMKAALIKKHWSHFYDLKKPFLLEKSISNTCRIPFLNKEFQPAYFIHIVRNGYAVAEGIQRKAAIMKQNPLYGNSKYPMELCANQWVKSLQKVEEDKAGLSNYLEITYEDLTADPGKVVNQIMDFLNLDHFDEDLSQNSFAIHEKKSKITNMNMASLLRLKDEDVEIINEVAGEYLQKYNYGMAVTA